MGRENDVILAAFRGTFLVEYDLEVDDKTRRLNANLRIVKKDSAHPKEELDIRASIPEDRILAKIYQIRPFGVKVAPEIDLKLAKKLPTKSRLEYLDDKVDIKTVKDAYTAFAKYLNDENTDVFFGKFGEKYETEDSDLKTYEGFYVLNSKTRNMMFFREEETGTDSILFKSFFCYSVC